MDDVERLFKKLVEVLATTYPDRLHAPLEASEIYQRMIPYRRFRSILKFDTNQDYEMAILRFLAGEHGYASVQPPQAQEELAAEASAINPDPSSIRDYAAVKVYLNTREIRRLLDERSSYAPPEERIDEQVEHEADEQFEQQTDEPFAAPATIASEEEPEDPVADEPEAAETESHEESESTQSDPIFQLTSETAAGTEEIETISCLHCGEELPPARKVLFCPFCGHDQRTIECRSCGAELVSDWKFCLSCGSRR
ncbi:MAG: zinc ribbon domain-containing protein [Gemmatimonadales bacterium]